MNSDKPEVVKFSLRMFLRKMFLRVFVMGPLLVTVCGIVRSIVNIYFEKISIMHASIVTSPYFTTFQPWLKALYEFIENLEKLNGLEAAIHNLGFENNVLVYLLVIAIKLLLRLFK